MRVLRIAIFGVLAVTFSWAQVKGNNSPSIAFTNFELSEIPTTSCPGSTLCYNGAAEPAIRADGFGNFFSSSENGLTSGTLAWRSPDGGKHYTDLVSPNSLSSATDSTFEPGGGDTDVAVATALNANGFFNVYVASLSGANVDVSTSQDQGGTWSLNPTSASIPGDDREWIAADGASKVCISYRTLVGTQLVVNCSFDAGQTFTQIGNAFDTNHAFFAAYNAEIGNLAIDPHNHYIYETFAAPANLQEASACTNCSLHVVWMGVSTDGGQNFTDYVVYNNPDVTVSLAHNFTNVSVDKAGNVYSVFSDNHNVYYSFSTDHGQTWSGPFQVSKTPSNTAIYPWSTAVGAGKIDIVWYGTSYYDGVNPPDSYPNSAVWYVYFAQSLNATKPGSNFSQTTATPIVHLGGVCEGGISCTGNRDLFDDFGVAASPTTGLASIIYSDDQYTASSSSPPRPGCTSSTNNSGSCDHSSIATQVSGPGIK
jgi:hypothetical protein